MRHVDLSKDHLRLDSLANGLIAGGLIVGALGLLASVAATAGTADGTSRFLHAYLINVLFFLSISLGALFFVIIQHLVRAGWSVVVRRIAEVIAGNVVLMGLLFIPILVALPHLYEWARPEAVAGDALLEHKAAYLDPTFFTVRVVVYFLVWIALASFYFRRSVAQDRTGDPGITIQMQTFSGPATLLYGLTVSMAGFDILMSLNPHWFSTIFGVYFFAGGVVGFLALMPIVIVALQMTGRMADAVSPEHFHDLGKLVFGFIVLWAYIAFSQFMLIWYGNIPEETSWYATRVSEGWLLPAILLAVGHFVLPFFGLMSRWVKRNRLVLSLGALWVLLMHWFDLYWLVMPGVSPLRVPLHLVDFTAFWGVGGLFLAAGALRLRHHALVPVKDPRLEESLAFENV
jgi:hypothetical protein